ncbi:MAG: helix-turn-helix transcriptional regulator [Clostridia bacterium]|nr:helix-turn-helix transcriptional regulator [Clostridia bacterium]
MQNIGKRIRELRKKNDLTQEKLADYLGVSYQAVSKWETGMSSPDLSLIRPLTKLLHVTADELLGIEENSDTRFVELEQMYKSTYTTGDLAERWRAANLAVSEYPGNPTCLSWLADAQYYHAYDFLPDEPDRYRAELEKSVRLSERVLEDCEDEEIRNHMLSNIVVCLSELGRRDEARIYAEQYPEKRNFGREELLSFCLTGEDLVRHHQEQIKNALENLCNALNSVWSLNSVLTAEAVIKTIIPDGNYVIFHEHLARLAIDQAKALTREGQYDEAVAALEKAKYHSREYDAIDLPENRSVYHFTAPLLNRIECDTRERCVSGTSTMMADFYEYHLPDKTFDPLRERENFRKLLERD